jgi:hypothetical protein
MSAAMPLRAGVLIIGSLFWDEENKRPEWRKARLDMAAAQIVTAPIRYGRKSQTRGNTYTMVLSRLCPVGQAKLVPCLHPVSSVHDLIAEAECLWKAELPDAKPNRIGSSWGCVALLCNPERSVPLDMLNGWATRVAAEAEYGPISQTKEEGVLVDQGDGPVKMTAATMGISF